MSMTKRIAGYYYVSITLPRGCDAKTVTRHKRGLAACCFERDHDERVHDRVRLVGKYMHPAARYVVGYCTTHGLRETALPPVKRGAA